MRVNLKTEQNTLLEFISATACTKENLQTRCFTHANCGQIVFHLQARISASCLSKKNITTPLEMRQVSVRRTMHVNFAYPPGGKTHHHLCKRWEGRMGSDTCQKQAGLEKNARHSWHLALDRTPVK
jgi:hypothetical protein